MRARKLAAVELEDMPPAEDIADIFLDRPDADAPAPGDDGEGLTGRVCLACGGDAPSHECAHDEVARLEAPSRAVQEAVSRLRRAAAEHRAATRALRAQVLSEVARGRGDLETAPPVRPLPCPRCLLRDAEEAAAAAGTPVRVKRKGRGDVSQQALPFKAS
jgi:hypothetical protein